MFYKIRTLLIFLLAVNYSFSQDGKDYYFFFDDNDEKTKTYIHYKNGPKMFHYKLELDNLNLTPKTNKTDFSYDTFQISDTTGLSIIYPKWLNSLDNIEKDKFYYSFKKSDRKFILRPIKSSNSFEVFEVELVQMFD